MAVVIEQAVADPNPGGFDMDITTGSASGLALICFAGDGTTDSDTATLNSDQDGAFTKVVNHTGLTTGKVVSIFCWVLWDPTPSVTHNITQSTGATDEGFCFEVSGLDSSQAVLTNTSSTTSATTQTTGDITTTVETFLAFHTSYAPSSAETLQSPVTTKHFDSSDTLISGVVVTTADTYNGDWLSDTTSSDSIIVGFQESAAGAAVFVKPGISTRFRSPGFGSSIARPSMREVQMYGSP